MGRKCGLDNSVPFNGFTTHKDRVKLQSSVFSMATQSTIEAGASRSRSFSEGTITRRQRDAEASTNSSEGTQLTCQSSIRRVSLEPVPFHKEIMYPDDGRVEQDRLVDGIQSKFKLISKVPYSDKHLMSESSSSNSSHAIAPNHSESKNQLETSVETKPRKEETRSNDMVRLSSDCSASLKKDEFSKEILKQLKSYGGQVTSDTSQLSEQLCSEKMKRGESVSPKTGHRSEEAACEGQQLPKLIATSDQDPNLRGFDLNEDLEINEVEQTEHPIDGSDSSKIVANVSEPIVVMAKIGVPNGLPTGPLRFDGELGWKRSSATSAFRPALPSKNSDINRGSCRNSTDSSSTPSLGHRGFDLNVAVCMDSSAMDSECTPPSEPHAVRSSVEIGLKESERLNLDLSCRGKNYHAEPKSRIQSFDLNANLSDQDVCSGLRHPDQNSHPKRNCAPTDVMKGSAKQSNSSGVRPAYWVDLSSMSGFSHVQGQPFLVAAPTLFPSAEQKPTLVPLHPNMAFTPAPPSGYYIGTTNGLPSSMYSPSILPHVGGQHGVSTTLPQINSPMLAAYPGSLHLLETGQVLNPGGYANMRPSFFLNGGVGSLENANRVANAPVEERMKSSQTVALPALTDKRREPDGGWDSYQLNQRRVTTWK